ncbi:MAG: sugar transferase [Pseudomonadota bacterium]
MPRDLTLEESALDEPCQEHIVSTSNHFKHGAAITGFLPRSEKVHRAYNLALGCFLLLLVSPLFLAISVALFATQGSGIFYRGPRLGRNRETFHIYKFRTLDTRRAEQLTSDKVLPKGSNLETPLGKYLRVSRLDELPQLLNVVLGDMNIVGPRPVRAQIAMKYAREIPNYTARFAVKPGLCGQSQAYMSHGTSKHIRARYNNLLCRAPVRYDRDVLLFTTVGLSVLRRAVVEAVRAILPSLAHRDATVVASAFGVELHSADGQWVHPVRAVSADFIHVPSFASIRPGDVMWLSFCGARGRHRRVRVKLSRYQHADRLFEIEPVSEYGIYVIERYLYDMVLVSERRPALHTPLVRAIEAQREAPMAARGSAASPGASIAEVPADLAAAS